MKRGIQGFQKRIPSAGENYSAFIPSPLPPEVPVVVDTALQSKMDETLIALGRLDSVGVLLPDLEMFLYSYVRREAVLSSEIEGTRSSLSDLLLLELDETPGVPVEDARTVFRYTVALDAGLLEIQEGNPITLRMIRRLHAILLETGRGSELMPGEFRRSQNWVGGSRPGNAVFVPPPPEFVLECMGHLENFINDVPRPTPILLKIGMAHVQFETIHPFLDGNGRIGRMLIPLMLCRHGVMHRPLLYLSLYFKQNRARYYELLNETRLTGDWEAWMHFFLDGVQEMAAQSYMTVRELRDLFEQDRQRIKDIRRVSPSLLEVHQELMKSPLMTAGRIQENTSLSLATIITALNRLTEMGILDEITGKQRGRIYRYKAYMDILTKESALSKKTH